VFACLENRVVMFMDAGTGQLEQRWEYSTGGSIPAGPVIDVQGNVRVHSRDGHLHVLDPGGQPRHESVPVGEPLNNASPLVDQQNNTWICRSEGGLMRVLPDGSVDKRPFLRTRQRLDCSGVIVEGTLYVGAENGCVYAVDLTAKRGENRWVHAQQQGRTNWYIHSALAVAPSGGIVVASNDDSVYCFNQHGDEQWKTEMNGKMLGSPVIDSAGSIYIGLGMDQRGGDGAGALACLDSKNGRLLWKAETDGRVESTPVIGSDGLIYFGDNTAKIHAVDSAGKRKWSEQVAARVRSGGAICAPNLLIFGLDNGDLVGLKCASPKLSPQGWPKLLGTGCQRGWPPGSS